MNAVGLSPLPDEFSDAHAGRIAIFKWGSISRSQRSNLIKKLAVERAGKSANYLPLDCQMATVTGMSRLDYIRNHSIVPAFRVVDDTIPPVPFGAEKIPPRYYRTGYKLFEVRTYICRACVQEDLSSHPYSWFRRIHNLPGIEWCTVHTCPLDRVTSPDPWLRLPHQWLVSGAVEPMGFDTNCRDEYQFQLRLCDAYKYLLARYEPFQRKVLQKAMHERKYQANPGDPYPCVSTTVSRNLPQGWVKRNCAEGRWLQALRFVDDRAWQVPALAYGFLYAMVLATLFDNLEDLEQLLASIAGKPITEITAS